ncbi:zinc-dependent alcohol dehydrogenase family protein [Denitratisoma oestradiolicum]|uniref:Alcohol dehydrogenase n=1 Tax=Denitratisoma oestradiolicum TaxID=311182 RepID=A0A6S6Y2Z5_9PROT|nr:NAD(P)-dependent alcohol dehydrogenase [Denitratisoma oestradiolicum]TWO79158.1 alcohol dehydrogenase [Denitratisoma oestradiolicum]CAB1369586.1 Alcohol dehydrogenase [Denitratisoma oestradiolicum]
MRAYEMGSQSGLPSLQMAERPDLIPGPDEVVLKVRSVCLNHRDLLALSGAYGAKRPSNRIPVSDGIGEVLAVGADVVNIQVGSRMICDHFVSWLDGPWSPNYLNRDLGISLDGWLAEQILVPANALVPVPDELSDEQAAPMAAAGLTAWNAVVEFGHIKAGDLVLALGTGGVSLMALNIAKLHGARVAVTSSSDEKLAMVRAMGADLTINYKTHPDWAHVLMNANNGIGADIVIENGGIATLSQSIAAAAPNARIALIGALAGNSDPALPNLNSIVVKNLILKGITVGNRRTLVDFVRAAAANRMSSVISRVFSFDEAAAAYAYLHAGDHIGKIMIRMF